MLTRQGSNNVRMLKCDKNGKILKKSDKRNSTPAFLKNKLGPNGQEYNHF